MLFRDKILHEICENVRERTENNWFPVDAPRREILSSKIRPFEDSRALRYLTHEKFSSPEGPHFHLCFPTRKTRIDKEFQMTKIHALNTEQVQ